MRNSAVLLAITLLPLAFTEGRAQSICALNTPVALSHVGASNATLKVQISSLRSAPGFTTAVPSQQTAGDCQLHTSPRPGVTNYRLTLRASGTLNPEGLRLRMISLAPQALKVSMEPVGLAKDVDIPADVSIEPISGAAAEYAVAFVISDNASADTLPFKLLWAPIPRIGFGTARQSCGTSICLYSNVPQEVNIRGTDVAEVDSLQKASVTYLPSLESESPIIDVKPEGLFLSVKAPPGTQRMIVQLPLLIARVTVGGGSPKVFTDTFDVGVTTAPAQQIKFAYSNGNQLEILRGASTGLRVRVSAEDNSPLSLPIGSYSLRELVMGQNGPPVAELYISTNEPSGIWGTLLPVAPTRTRTGRDGAPELVLDASAGRRLTTNLQVLPPTHIEKVYVRRLGQSDQLGGAVRPLEHAHLRLEGPGVALLTGGRFADEVVQIARRGVRDTLEIEVDVPRAVGLTEQLRMDDIDGAEVPVSIPTEPNQRAKTVLDFIELAYRDGSKTKTLTFTSPPPAPNQNTENRGLRRATHRHHRLRPDRNQVDPSEAAHPVPEASTLGGVSLRVYPERIDGVKLYGVQYLLVDVELTDAAGNSAGKFSRCLAVVPPPVAQRIYVQRGDCTRVVSGEFRISDLLDASTRATSKSSMRIRIRHDPSQYLDDDVGGEHEIELRRKGWVVLEPRLQLPGPVMAFYRGRTSPGITFTGALFSAQPLLGDNWLFNHAHTLSFQGGFLVGTAPTGSGTESISGRLSLAAGASYMFRNMVGNVALDFFGGRIYPISGRGVRARDAYWVLRPGFSVAVGGSAK